MPKKGSGQRPATRLAHGGRDPKSQHGVVNPPVYRASTVLFPDVAALREASANPLRGVYYGRYGTPTHFAFEAALTELESGHGTVTASSGLAAISIALLSTLKAGEHVLVADNVYAPTRKLCDGLLKSLGIDATYFDPLAQPAMLEALFRTNTRALVLEAPGSLTFEICDVPALAALAHRRDAVVLMDNTWATPLYFQALAHGVDIAIYAATKYLVGHADAMLGALVCNERCYLQVKGTAIALGQCAGPDDVYLGLRGLRTLSVRLKQHGETAMQLASWLQQQPEVARILHPALPHDPGHALWRRDFIGATGLFGVVLREGTDERALTAMLDHLTLFGLGYSWGGYESLILPTHPAEARTATRWSSGPTLRIHAGLEDPDDLIADLRRGFEVLRSGADPADPRKTP